MCFFVPQVQKEKISQSVIQDSHHLRQVKQTLMISFLVLIPNFFQNESQMLNLEDLLTPAQSTLTREEGLKVQTCD